MKILQRERFPNCPCQTGSHTTTLKLRDCAIFHFPTKHYFAIIIAKNLCQIFLSLRHQRSLTDTTVWTCTQLTWCLRTHWDTNPGPSSKPNGSNRNTNWIWPAFQRLHRLLGPTDYLETGSEGMFCTRSAGPAQNFKGRGAGKDRGKMAGTRETQGSVES